MQVGKEVMRGQAFANSRADHRCPTQSAANNDIKYWLLCVFVDTQTNVMHVNGSAIDFATAHRNFKLAWQPLELWMHR